MCGSNENLCIHHIDGFDETKPENSNANKMITLCRKCHSNVHAGTYEIPKDVLESIGYYDEDGDSNESNEICNGDVTACNTEIEKEKEIEKESDIEVDTRKHSASRRFTPPTIEEVKSYCQERNNNVDAERFVDFYTANGWTQGKGKPIRDWKACVRTWERSSYNNKSKGKRIGPNGVEISDDPYEEIIPGFL